MFNQHLKLLILKELIVVKLMTLISLKINKLDKQQKKDYSKKINNIVKPYKKLLMTKKLHKKQLTLHY